MPIENFHRHRDTETSPRMVALRLYHLVIDLSDDQDLHHTQRESARRTSRNSGIGGDLP